MNQTPSHHHEAREVKYNQLPEVEKNEILLNPELISRQGFELEAQTNSPQKGCLRSKLQLLLASYCEITEAASLLRKKWLVLLSAFVCSRIALEIKEPERAIPFLFLVSYSCLSLLLIEDLVRCCYLKTASSGPQRVECMFGIIHKALMMLFILSLNLQYFRLMSPIVTLLPPLLFLAEFVMYLKNPLISQSQENDMRIVERIFYVLQSWMIAIKINNLVDLGWRGTLALLWIYLITYALYALLAGLLLFAVTFATIVNLDFQTLVFLRSRIFGYIWHISYHGLYVVGFILLLGVFEKVDSDEDEILQVGLLCARKLSAFLLIYSTLLFQILKRFNASSFDDLRFTLQNQVVPRKKYTLIKAEEEEDQKKKAFFLMVSHTYFSLLTEEMMMHRNKLLSKGNGNENSTELAPSQQKEESLCYICEDNVSNAILTECGHGGVCYECAVRSIEQKNECMGCRKPAKSIYRIDSYSRSEAEIIVQASEIIQIIDV